MRTFFQSITSFLSQRRSAASLGLGLFLLAWFSGVPSASAQLGKPEGLYYKSWAVIIGVEQYLLAPPIPGTVADAKTVAQEIGRAHV